MGSWTELLLLLVIRAGAVTRGGRAWSANRSRKRGVTCSYPEVPGASTRHRPVRTDPDATSWSRLIPVEQADAGVPMVAGAHSKGRGRRDQDLEPGTRSDAALPNRRGAGGRPIARKITKSSGLEPGVHRPPLHAGRLAVATWVVPSPLLDRHDHAPPQRYRGRSL
jgi:hypothetical protein